MNKPFNSWRVGAPYYLPLFLFSFAITWINFGADTWYLSIPFWAAALFTLNFFRDPPRTISSNPEDIVSPADGKIDAIEELEDSPYYDGPCICVSIFLNVFNVHINRAPDDCVVRDIQYKEGLYKNAMDPESRKVNEANTIYLDTKHGPMTVRQISGAIARRIVCETETGGQLQKGEKFGMIRFGSRTELYMPASAEVIVNLKDNVHGGSTIIAKLDTTN